MEAAIVAPYTMAVACHVLRFRVTGADQSRHAWDPGIVDDRSDLRVPVKKMFSPRSELSFAPLISGKLFRSSAVAFVLFGTGEDSTSSSPSAFGLDDASFLRLHARSLLLSMH